jgi:hypothetical protein
MIMRKCLRCLFWLGLLGAMLVPSQVRAAEVSFKSDTILRGFERDTVQSTGAAVVPAYEYLQVDVETPGEPGLAFHLYGWGRWDLADNGYFEDATEGELLYGYLEYSRQLARFNARLGRQSVFEGVANETLDGLRLSSDLGKYFSGSIYAGQQVALTSENGRDGDKIYGGRLAHHLAGWYDLGVSYKKIRNDSDDAEELAGVDLTLYLPAGINLSGSSSYNLLSEDWGEHSYELSAKFGPVSLRPFVQRFQYDDYFNAGVNSANPFRFLAGTGEELTIIGADLNLSVTESWVLVGKVKHYDYEVFDGSSKYYSAQAIWTKEGHSQIGGELGFMNSDVAQNDYFLARIFSYWDQMAAGCPIDFISGDLVYVGYDQKIYDEDRSLFVSLGLGKKFLDDALELKVSGDYSSDPYFDKDLRGMLTASYRLGRSL